MRVLCTCVPAKSHFYGMVPLARAMKDAGHEVIFATAPEFHSEVAAAELNAIGAGLSIRRLRDVLEARFPGSGALPPDKQAALMFCEIAPRAMRDDMIPFAKEWRPHLVVHDEGEFAGPLVAACLKIPNISVGWSSPVRSPQMLQLLDLALAKFWDESGLQPIALGGMYKYMFLDACPPSLQAAHVLQLGPHRPMRPVLYSSGCDKPVPQWLGVLDSCPTVHVTFGTVPVYNNVPKVYDAILAGLSQEHVNVILTIGDDLDPRIFSLSNHIYVERYLPHPIVLPYCDVVYCHGGCGSTVAALVHGLPLLITPRGGGTQQRNANACAQTGAGRILCESEINAESVRHNIRALLDLPVYKLSAQRIANEIREMPAPGELVDALARVAMNNCA